MADDLTKEQRGDWRHIANEWADMATNGVQWLRNIRDGISTPEDALGEMEENHKRIQALPRPISERAPGVVNMILHCPKCGLQHVDAPDDEWTNPPHRSHLCHGCGCIWRPADVPTNGVKQIETEGRADEWKAPGDARQPAPKAED